MNRELRCGDLIKGCAAVLRGATDDEVMKKAAEHARQAHQIEQITPDLAAQVKSAIHNA